MAEKLNTMKVFFEEPSREFNIREAARLLKIAPATASKELSKMEKEGLLKKRDERMLKLYRANIENESYKDLKLFYNIRKIKEELIEELNKFYLKPTIILFGSASKGSDVEDSDFDLIIVSEKTKEFPDIKKFEKKINRKIQLFAVKNIKDLKNNHLINNILNGIVLQGELKWI